MALETIDSLHKEEMQYVEKIQADRAENLLKIESL
jgi:hypothetical protein